LLKGRKKKTVPVAAESPSVANWAKFCEKMVPPFLYISLALGAVLFAPDYFYDFFEVPKLFFVQLGAAVICFLLLCAAALRGRLHLRLPVVVLPLIFTAAMAVLSVGWSLNRGLALEKLYHLGSLVVFCFVAFRIYRGRQVEKPLLFIVFTAAFLAVFALALDWYEPFQKWVYPYYVEVIKGTSRDYYRNLISTQGNPNFLMQILVLTVPAALGALIHRVVSGRAKTSRILFHRLALAGLIVSFCVPLICFFKSENRSSLVGFVFALLVFLVLALVFNRGRISKFFLLFRPLAAKFLALVTVVVLATALALIFSESAKSLAVKVGESATQRLEHWKVRFGNLADTDNVDVYSRVIFLETSAAMIADNPLLGKGIGQFLIYFPGYKTPEHWYRLQLTLPEIKRWAEIATFAHNDYLQVFVELGVFAFISFLLFWFLLAHLAFGSLRRSSGEPEFFLLLGIISGIAGTLFNALFTFPLQTVTSGMFFWVLTGLLLVLCERYAPKGRMTEWACQLSITDKKRKLILVAFAGAMLVVCVWGSFRIIRSQYLFFDALKKQTSDLDYSIRQCKRATELAPHHFEFHYVQGWFYQNNRNPGAARKSFERAAVLAPYFPETYKFLAKLYFAGGDYRKSEQSIKRYVDIYPWGDRTSCNNMLGIICLQDTMIDRITEADSLLREGGSVDALMSLAIRYRERGNPKAAMSLAPQAIRGVLPGKQLEKFLSITAFFGHTALEAGDTVAAADQFGQIIKTLKRFDPHGYTELRRQTLGIIEELDVGDN
jgi:O-antigen ligase